jgi:hypothetical protein
MPAAERLNSFHLRSSSPSVANKHWISRFIFASFVFFCGRLLSLPIRSVFSVVKFFSGGSAPAIASRSSGTVRVPRPAGHASRGIAACGGRVCRASGLRPVWLSRMRGSEASEGWPREDAKDEKMRKIIATDEQSDLHR